MKFALLKEDLLNSVDIRLVPGKGLHRLAVASHEPEMNKLSLGASEILPSAPIPLQTHLMTSPV